MRLSKSQFIRGLQCPKSLWLYKYQSELRQEPDESQQALFEAGTNVGLLAQQLFPGGEEIIFDYKKISDNVRRTQKLIQDGVTTIYEATFVYDDVLIMADIFHKGADGWELYEVKSSTKAKDVHENDVAIQYYVLSGAGLDMSKAALVHINNQYVREGDLDVRGLFTIVDLTESASDKQHFVKTELQRIKTLVNPGTLVPKIDIGQHCSDPYDCDFCNHCWNHIPEKSVFTLNRLRNDRKFEIYKRGIISFDQIPDDYPLTSGQRIQVEAELNETEYINKKFIREFIESIVEPTGFLDFETFMQPVPNFDGQRPYQQIPFQYSLHIQQNGKLDHYEFLAEAGRDPRFDFTRRLIDDTESCQMIVVYNQTFENRILAELANMYPRLEQQISTISDRIVDLMALFQSKSYYVRAMDGSYSIKKVLPALVPKLSYDAFDIADGGMAMQAYAGLQNEEDHGKIAKVRNDLLRYCELDTLAMVEIMKKLQFVV